MAYQMATQRRKLTVLGSVKAPKPVNLPSQKRENNGLDPTIALVPPKTASGSGSVWGNPAAEGPPAPPTPHIPPPRPTMHTGGPAWGGAGLPDARKEASAFMAEEYPTLAVGPEVEHAPLGQGPAVLRVEDRGQTGRETGPPQPPNGRPFEGNGSGGYRAPCEASSGENRAPPERWVPEAGPPPPIPASDRWFPGGPPQNREYVPDRYAGPRGGHQQVAQPYYNGPHHYGPPLYRGQPHNIPPGPGMHPEYHNGPPAVFGRGPRPEHYVQPDARMLQGPPPPQQHHVEREGNWGEVVRHDGGRDPRQTWHPPHPPPHHPQPNFQGAPPPGAHPVPPPGGHQPQMVLPSPPSVESPRATDAQMKVLRRELHEGDLRLVQTGPDGRQQQVIRNAPMLGGPHARPQMPGGPQPGMPHMSQRPPYGPGPGGGFPHGRSPPGVMPPPHHMQMHGMGMGYGAPYPVHGNPNIPPPPPPPHQLPMQPPMQGQPPMEGPPQSPPMHAPPQGGPVHAPPQAVPVQPTQPSSPMLFGSMPVDPRTKNVVLNQSSAVMFGGEARVEVPETLVQAPANLPVRQAERGHLRQPQSDVSMPKVVPRGTPTVSEIEELQIAQQRGLQEAVLSQPQAGNTGTKQGSAQQEAQARPRELGGSGSRSTGPEGGGGPSQGRPPAPAAQKDQRQDKERPIANGLGASKEQDFPPRRAQDRKEREGKRRENREGSKGGPKNGMVNGVQAADTPHNGEMHPRQSRENRKPGAMNQGPRQDMKQQPRPQPGGSAPASPRLAMANQRTAGEPRRPSEGYKRDRPRAVPREPRRAMPVSDASMPPPGLKAAPQAQDSNADRSMVPPAAPKGPAQVAPVSREQSGDGSHAGKEHKGKKAKQQHERKEKAAQGPAGNASSGGGGVEGGPSVGAKEGQGVRPAPPPGIRKSEQAKAAPQEGRLVKDALKAVVPDKPDQPRPPMEASSQNVTVAQGETLLQQDRPREKPAPPPGLTADSQEAPRAQPARRERGGKKMREKRERQVAAAAGVGVAVAVPVLPPGLSSSSGVSGPPNPWGSGDGGAKKAGPPPGLLPQGDNGPEQKPEQKPRPPRSDRPNRPPRDIYHPPGAAGKNGGSSSTGNGPNASANEGKTGEGKRHREKRASDGGTGRGNAHGGTENGDERRVREGLPPGITRPGDSRPATGDGQQGQDKAHHKANRKPKQTSGPNTNGGAGRNGDKPVGESDAGKHEQPKRANNPKEGQKKPHSGGGAVGVPRSAAAAPPRAVPIPAAVPAS